MDRPIWVGGTTSWQSLVELQAPPPEDVVRQADTSGGKPCFDLPKAQSEEIKEIKEIKESQTVWEWISEKMGDPDRGEGIFIASTLAGS